jgi:hypothetical protein
MDGCDYRPSAESVVVPPRGSSEALAGVVPASVPIHPRLPGSDLRRAVIPDRNTSVLSS